ncbi:MAG: hypothetical protein J0G30_12550 [Actinomycetales bacterium]|nr:hypothetical protein [Actinomycetales bacterium]
MDGRPEWLTRLLDAGSIFSGLGVIVGLVVALVNNGAWWAVGYLVALVALGAIGAIAVRTRLTRRGLSVWVALLLAPTVILYGLFQAVAATVGQAESDTWSWIVVAAAVTLAVLCASLHRRVENVETDRVWPRWAWLSMASISLIGALIFGLGSFAAGVAIEVALEQRLWGAISLGTEMTAAALVALPFLVGRRSVAALMMVVSSPLICAVGVASLVAGDTGVGWGLLVVAASALVFGCATFFASGLALGAIWVLCGGISAILAGYVMSTSRTLGVGLMLLSIAVSLAGVLVAALPSGWDPFPMPDDSSPWGGGRYAIALVASSGAFALALAGIALVPPNQPSNMWVLIGVAASAGLAMVVLVGASIAYLRSPRGILRERFGATEQIYEEIEDRGALQEVLVELDAGLSLAEVLARLTKPTPKKIRRGGSPLRGIRA